LRFLKFEIIIGCLQHAVFFSFAANTAGWPPAENQCCRTVFAFRDKLAASHSPNVVAIVIFSISNVHAARLQYFIHRLMFDDRLTVHFEYVIRHVIARLNRKVMRGERGGGTEGKERTVLLIY